MGRLSRFIVTTVLAAVAVGGLGEVAASGATSHSRNPALRWSRPIPLGRHGHGAALLAGYGGTSTGANPTPAVAIACPIMAQCAMASDRAVTFNPLTGRILHGFSRVDGDTTLTALACPTARQCTALDAGGYEVTYDPRTGRANRAGLRQVDSGENTISAVSCPSVRQCTEVDKTGEEATFDPATGRLSKRPALVAVQPAPDWFHIPNYALFAVACPAVTQCTAVGQTYEGGRPLVTTFNPRTGQINSTGVIYLRATQPLTSVACPTSQQCTATDLDGSVITFDPAVGPLSDGFVSLTADHLFGVSCPSGSDCTTVDGAGNAYTFDPDRPAAAHRVRAGRRSGLFAVDCPSRAECVAVTGAGYATVGLAVRARRR